MAAAGEQAPALVARIIDAVHPAVEGLARQPAPVVAVVQGAAAGAGVSLALGADILIMADTARLTLGYGALGTVPDCGGSFHLARRLGPGRALLWLAENRAMPAEEALTLGLAHRVVPEADLEAEAEALCARLVAGPRLALAAARSLLRGAALRDLPDHLTAERNAFLQCAGTADFREGLAAFLARRPARFAN
jgi:2-(1,2-epoxy-1,2-dihydrophenyl)acetyl-CoA isomerase